MTEYSVVYSSKTGNTALLADAVAAALPQGTCRYRGAPDPKATQTELVLVGFWTEMGTCDKATAEFLKTLHGKQVFLFGTAGFGGSEAYFNDILGRTRQNLAPDNTVAGSYMCPGKMPMNTRQRYEAKLAETPDDPRMQNMIDNFDKALIHPDSDDLAKLTALVRRKFLL